MTCNIYIYIYMYYIYMYICIYYIVNRGPTKAPLQSSTIYFHSRSNVDSFRYTYMSRLEHSLDLFDVWTF